MPEVRKMLRQLILLMKYMEKDRKDDPKQTIGEFLQNIKKEAMPGEHRDWLFLYIVFYMMKTFN